MRNKKHIPKKIDIAVIGAGMGGLISALELQKQGFNVCVFEKRPIPGGYAHSFKRKKFNFDVSLHHIGGLREGSMTYNILKPLNVLEKLSIQKPDIFFTARFPDKTYVLPNSENEIIEYLGEQFPDEKSSLKELFMHLREIKYHVTGPILFTDFNVSLKELISLKYRDTSFKQLLDFFINDKKLITVLSQMWMYLGLPPEKATANYSTCIFSSGFIEGSYHVKGGGAAVTKAIVESFKEIGGQCFYKNGVKRIVIENGIAKGIELENGEKVEANIVISNASPFSVFFDLTEDGDVSKIYRHRIKLTEPSFSIYAMYIGTDCLPSELGIPDTNYFYNNSYDYTESYKNCLNKNIEKTDWCVTSFETADPDLSPEGEGIVSIVEITPPGLWFDLTDEEYDKEKERVKQILLLKYNKQFPGLSEHAKIIEFGTPRTMRRYSGNYLGAIYGFANKVNEPKSKGLGNRTPVKGLYLSGSWAQDGGGYEGSMMSGLQAANLVMKDLNFIKKPLRSIKDIQRQRKPNFEIKGYPYFVFKAKVYPDDTDYTGKIKATAYLRILDRARVSLVSQSDEIKQLEPMFREYHVNVYKLNSYIHAYADVDEDLIVKTGYRKTTSHRAAVDQAIFTSAGKLLAENITQIMFVRKNGGLVELPEVYQEHKVLPLKIKSPALSKILFSDNNHYKYETELTVFYEDTDAQGIVYNVSFIKFCERAFWNLRKKILPNYKEFNNIKTTRMILRYLKSASLSNVILIKSGYRKIDEKSFAIDYRITNKHDQSIYVDGYFEYEL